VTVEYDLVNLAGSRAGGPGHPQLRANAGGALLQQARVLLLKQQTLQVRTRQFAVVFFVDPTAAGRESLVAFESGGRSRKHKGARAGELRVDEEHDGDWRVSPPCSVCCFKQKHSSLLK